MNTIITETQLYPGSIAMDTLSKTARHERRVMTFLVENFRLTTLDLAIHTHLSQIVQAETMLYACKSCRRDWGGRKCGGVLVWKLTTVGQLFLGLRWFTKLFPNHTFMLSRGY